MDDILQKAFDESLDQTIAARSQFDSAKAALEAKIRAKIETKLEAMPIKKRVIGNVGETAAGLTDRYVDECIWEAKRVIAAIFWEEKGVRVPVDKIGDEMTHLVLPRVGERALAAIQ